MNNPNNPIQTVNDENHSSLLNIPKEKYFFLPEGNYQALIAACKPTIRNTNSGAETWLTILFDVDIPGLNHKCYPTARRQFSAKLERGSDFRNFLEGLLGRDFFSTRSGEPFDHESLVGQPCEVCLKHLLGKNHKHPLVLVMSVHPRGTLQLTASSLRWSGNV